MSTKMRQYPLPMAFPQIGSDNLNAQTLLCDIYNGINSIEPLAIAGEGESVVAGISWALDKLADVGLSDTVLGCVKNSLSPKLYPHSTIADGSLNPPKSVQSNVGGERLLQDILYRCTYVAAMLLYLVS